MTPDSIALLGAFRGTGDTMPEETEAKQQSDGEDLGCCVHESDMLIVRDKNMAYPWKGGNQYARICPECGSRKFCSESYWQMAEPQFVIKKGESEPKIKYSCPYEDCGGSFVGQVDECPECEQEFVWEE